MLVLLGLHRKKKKKKRAWSPTKPLFTDIHASNMFWCEHFELDSVIN